MTTKGDQFKQLLGVLIEFYRWATNAFDYILSLYII